MTTLTEALARIEVLESALREAGIIKPTEPQRWPFNLEAALAGAKLVTRDGLQVSGFAPLLNKDYPWMFYADGGVRAVDAQGRHGLPGTVSRHDLFLAEPWPRPEVTPEPPKLGDGWPWVPESGDGYWRVSAAGEVDYIRQSADWHDQRLSERFNCYPSEAEAQARAELDKRLAIHAALRQLGGGDEGSSTVRYNRETKKWQVDNWPCLAPGEARFLTKETAKAALDVLLERGILKHGVAL